MDESDTNQNTDNTTHSPRPQPGETTVMRLGDIALNPVYGTHHQGSDRHATVYWDEKGQTWRAQDGNHLLSEQLFRNGKDTEVEVQVVKGHMLDLTLPGEK